MKSRAPSLNGRIAELDAFRAFGVLMVMLTHTWPGEYSRMWSSLQMSWILMDGFFVISGFLITGILLDARAEQNFYLTFYTRRALRILPLYYVVIIVLTLLGTILNTPGYREMLESWGSPLWFFGYAGNIPTALTGRFPLGLGDSLVPLWSLQVEEQFYLIFPLLVHQLQPRILTRALWTLAALSVIFRIAIYFWDPSNQYAQYVLLPCRMEGLAFGALIAVRLRQGPWELNKTRLTCVTVSWLATAIFCAAISGFQFQSAFNRTLGFLVSSIAASRMVLWFIWNRNSKVTEALRWKPVQYIGRVSYGAYLLHEPIQWIVTSVDRRLGLQWFQRGFLIVPVVIVLTLIAAAISWRYLEAPLLNLKSRKTPQRDEQQLAAA